MASFSVPRRVFVGVVVFGILEMFCFISVCHVGWFFIFFSSIQKNVFNSLSPVICLMHKLRNRRISWHQVESILADVDR